jgi:hypothetical protein
VYAASRTSCASHCTLLGYLWLPWSQTKPSAISRAARSTIIPWLATVELPLAPFSYIKHNLTNIMMFYYITEVLRWQVPQIILFYHRYEVQVLQVPRMEGTLVGYGSESSATSRYFRKRFFEENTARETHAEPAREPSLTCDGQKVLRYSLADPNCANLESTDRHLSRLAPFGHPFACIVPTMVRPV